MTATDSKIELLLHRRIAGATPKAVAEAIGTDDTFVSKLRNKDRGLRLDQIGPFLACVGLKLVDAGEVTVSPEYLHAIETLSRLGIGNPPKP